MTQGAHGQVRSMARPRTTPVPVALVHDYLTQRGGAERVALLLTQVFPGAPIHTSLFEPAGTFSEFAAADVRATPLNRVKALRRNHRLCLPLLAPIFSSIQVSARVVLCSSSGWAHGVRTSGRKIVYCYAPARWLYQTDRYLGPERHTGSLSGILEPRKNGAANLRRALSAASLQVIGSRLRTWDQRAAHSAARYLTSSTAMVEAIHSTYGIEAELLPPPPALRPGGPARAVAGLKPDFLLCVSRLLPYKNVGAIVQAVGRSPDSHLIVVGDGPERLRLESAHLPNVRFLGKVDDPTLRWLYSNCRALVAASYEDYGLTPLEAASFGRPSVVLRAGGFLDTVAEGKSGVFFDAPKPESVASALAELQRVTFDRNFLRRHAESFGEDRFRSRIRSIVDEELEREAGC